MNLENGKNEQKASRMMFQIYFLEVKSGQS